MNHPDPAPTNPAAAPASLPAHSLPKGDAAERVPNTPPLRVRYDISILGYAHVYGSTGKTGIHRVVEELGFRLAASPRCALSLSALHCYPDAQRYLAETPRWAGYKLALARDKSLLRAALKQVNARIDSNRPRYSMPLRLARKPLHWIYGFPSGTDYPDYPVGDLRTIDVFHSASAGLPPGLKRRRGLACFQTVYDLIPVLFDDVVVGHQRQHMAATLRALKEDNWALAISQSTKNDLCGYTGMDPDRVFVTPLAADPAKFYPCRDAARVDDVRARYAIPPGPYLLSVCTLEPRKNLDTLIRCFAQVASEPGMSEYSLVLTGNVGWKDQKIYETLAQTPGLKGRVVVTGYVADDDLAPLYSGATAFAYPSLYEGFGLPPLEAMQCGTPTLTSDTSSLPEVVGDAGIMASPRDEDALCQGMLDLCLNGVLRADLAARALVRAAQFSWERCTTQTLDAYAAGLAGS